MNVWTQSGTGAWARDEKLSLYNLFVAIIGVLVAIIAVLVGLLVPNIRAALSLDEKQHQLDETIRVVESQEITIRKIQADVGELQAELERIKADKAAAEQRAEQAESRIAIWQIARIENLTQYEISYQILDDDGSWTLYTLGPNQSLLHQKKSLDIKIRYSYCLNGTRQWEEHTLWNTSKVAGQEPTEAERLAAPTSYFAFGNQSQLLFYAKR